jgi:TnpA family transposase
VEQVASRAEVVGAANVVVELVPDDSAGETAMRQRLAGKYQSVRPFLVLLAEALPMGSTSAAADLLAEVRRLPDLARRRVSQKPLREAEVNEDLVPRLWQRAVFANPALLPGEVDRDAYVLCILEGLHRALRRRDVFASPSNRWSDPRAQLLDGAEWILVRDEVLTSLGLTGGVEAHLAEVCAELDAGWQQLADRIAEAGPDAGVRIEPDAENRMRLSVARLDAVAEPASQRALRGTVATMIPHVDLPELLLEVHAWTGCLSEFTNVSGSATRLDDLHITVAALLVAEACNVGLTPVTKPGDAALTRDRLSHVAQNYLRAETFSAANARLIEAQAWIATAALWGGGLLASVDGLRFTVPVATINASPNPKYFGRGRGLTWLNAMNDQFSGIGATVVPGTERDSLYVLDTLLNLDAGPDPEMVTSDTASYSNMVFGIFRLLGYRFAPRIADQRLWRAAGPDGRRDGDYGPLNAIARHKVNLNRIRVRWSDMVRVAGSLVDGRVRAYDLLRMLSRDGNPTPLGQAFAEYGRVAKTVHLLAFIDPVDETYRRSIGRQQNMTESRHQLARKIYHGQPGQMYKSYREGQEDQLGALGLVLNAVVLCYLGWPRVRPLRTTREVWGGWRVICVQVIWGVYGTERDGSSQGARAMSSTAAWRAGRRANLDGTRSRPSGGRTGGGIPGVPAGATGLAEHGEVLRSGTRSVVGAPGLVRTGLGHSDVGELRRLSDVAALRRRPASCVVQARSCAVRGVHDRGAVAGGAVLLHVSPAQRGGHRP